MTTVNASELIGAELDYAVAVATGEEHPQIYDGKVYVNGPKRNALAMEYSPSTDWVQGGPLLGTVVNWFEQYDDNNCGAGCADTIQYGPTPLIAICRAVVAQKSEELKL